MEINARIDNDPRWESFRERFSADPNLFASEVLNIDLRPGQRDVTDLVSKPKSRVAIVADNDVGTTLSIANICLWHLTCFAYSNTIIVGSDMDQVRTTLWKEIDFFLGRIKGGPYTWLLDYIDISTDGQGSIKGHDEEWFIDIKESRNKDANRFAGLCADHLLIIVNEASNVPDSVIATLSGALSSGDGNRMAIVSNLTRSTGFFYRACFELSIHNGGKWVPLRLGSVILPKVNFNPVSTLH